jgi:hypothetical protein
MMEYPYFFRMKVQNLNLNQGKMIAAASLRPKRALSIVNSTTKEFLNDQKTGSKSQIGVSASTTVVSPRNFGDSMSARPITVDPM